MSTSVVHRSMTAGVTSSGRAPLWAIGLCALLLIFGFARRRSEDASRATRDLRPLEAGRGRFAETPSQIPGRGWKDILLRVYHGVSEDRILLVAAGVTFYSLLAIFPGVAALISIYGLFADPATVASHLDTIASVAPGGAVDVLREQMTRLASQGGTTLGVSFLVSLAISLWTTNSGVKALFDAFNIVYGEEEKRSFLKLNAVSLLVTFGVIVFILVTLAAVVALPAVLNYIPPPEVTAFLVKIGRCPSFSCSSRWRWRSCTDTVRAAPSDNGAGSPGAARLLRVYGLRPRPCSHGMSRILAAITRPTVLSAQSSAL
jgi:membrane protein